VSGSCIHISLLGEFRIEYESGLTPSFSGDRPISLLAYLLLHRQAPVSRQYLAYTLWPDSSDSQARTNLRNLYYTLRKTLPDADQYIAADSMTLQWRSDTDVMLDVAEFDKALAATKTAVSAQEKITFLEQAAELYKGDLLPGSYDDWIMPLREELRQAFVDALQQLVGLLEQEGQYRSAMRVAQRLIQHDPLDEPAYVQLMRLHALNGDRAGVRRVYEACVSALGRELNLEPSPATQAAYEELLRLPIAAAPSTPALELLPDVGQIRPLPLPVPATHFIGRELELAQTADRLADPACRLLTIVGPGGIGKTRLALQTAVNLQPLFNDGSAWVALNALQTGEQLAAAVAGALNQRLRGVAGAEKELFPLLANKELLIVLDNAEAFGSRSEHLLPSTGFLSRLLEQSTAVKLLVTSRQALGLPQEWRFDLGALPLPEEEADGFAEGNSAVQLFVQSGRRAAGSFSPTENDYLAIANICRLVGGMPLGIELAASWLRLLSPAEIAREIENSLDFLTTAQGHLPPRHRSLRAVFDYSWSLLSPDEQQILLRLSVFQGGFTREAARQVAMADLPQLSALVDRSLVQRTGSGRYNLHNVIRQYAAEAGAAADTDADAAENAYGQTRQRHSDFFLRWLAEQDSALRGAGQKGVLTAVSAELANIRAAWQYALVNRQTDLLGDAAFPLFYFFELRGLLSEGEAVLRTASEALQQGMDTSGDRAARRTICALNIYQAFLGFRQGKVAGAEALLRSAVSEAEALAATFALEASSFEVVQSHAMLYLGVLEWAFGRFEEAVGCLQNSLVAAGRQQAQWEAVMDQVYLGMVRLDQGLLAEARRLLIEAQPAANSVGDPRLLANAALIFGRINLLLGRLDEAEQSLAECLEMSQETRDPNSITYALLYLGMVKQAQGDLPAARQLMEQSMALYAKFNDLVGLERAWVTMGFLELAADDLGAARDRFLSFLKAKERTHSIRYVLAVVLGMASVRALSGDFFTALVWTTAVLQHRGIDWEARQRGQTLYAELESWLTPQQIADGRQQAESQSFESVLDAVVNL